MAKVRYDVDAAAVIKAEKDIQAAQAGTIKGLKEEVEAAKKADAQTRKFLNSGLDARGWYNKKLSEGVELVKRGKLTQEEATRVLARHRKKLDETAAAGKGAFGGPALAGLKSYFSAATSIATAVGAIRSELQAAREEGERANQAQQTALRADRAFNRAVAGIESEEEKTFVRDAADRIIAGGFDRTRVKSLLSETISSQPDPRQAVALVDQFILETVDLTIEDAAKFLGGTGDVANALKTRDLARARGVIASVQTAARLSGPESTKNVARNAPQVLTAFKADGADPVLGAALFAGLSVGGADDLGERARTAGILVPEKLKQFFANDTRGRRRENVDELDEQLRAVFEDGALARQFVEESKFGVRSAAGVKEVFLDPSSEARNAFNRVLSAVGSPGAQRAAGVSATAEVISGPFEAVERTDRAIATAAERSRLSVEAPISEERRRDLLDLRTELIRRSEPMQFFPDAAASLRTFIGAGGTVTREEAIQIAEAAIREARQSFAAENGTGALFAGDGPTTPRIDEVIGLLQDMVAELRSANGLQAAGSQE